MDEACCRSARNCSSRVRRFSAGGAGRPQPASAAGQAGAWQPAGSGASIRSSPVPSVWVIGSPFDHDHGPANHGFVAARRRLGGRLHLKDELGRVLGDLARFGRDFVGNAQQLDLGRAGKIFLLFDAITSSVVLPCSTAAA